MKKISIDFFVEIGKQFLLQKPLMVNHETGSAHFSTIILAIMFFRPFISDSAKNL